MRLFSGVLTLFFSRAFNQPHPPLRGPPSPSRGRLARRIVPNFLSDGRESEGLRTKVRLPLVGEAGTVGD